MTPVRVAAVTQPFTAATSPKRTQSFWCQRHFMPAAGCMYCSDPWLLELDVSSPGAVERLLAEMAAERARERR